MQKNSNFRNYIYNIKIDGIDVEQVYHAKCLEIFISHDLYWIKHVENIVGKIGKRLYMHMLYQMKHAGIRLSDLVTVVRPVLEYPCLCVIPTYNNTCQTIEK